MKYKKVSTGGYDGSPDGMMKHEDVFLPMSPEAMVFRHNTDPCINTSSMPLNLATGSGSKMELPYPYQYSVTATSTAPTASDLMRNLPYQQSPYYPSPHLSTGSIGLDTMGHRQHDTLAMSATAAVAPTYPKYTNNNMGYHPSPYNTGGHYTTPY